MKFGYMGISKPVTRRWADGRMVTIYPSGKVVANETGEIIKQPDQGGNGSPQYGGKGIPQNLRPNISIDPNLILAAFVILGIVAIVAISRGK